MADRERRAFKLTQRANGYRMLQLPAPPLKTMQSQESQAALIEIGKS